MPYIKKDQRDNVNDAILHLAEAIQETVLNSWEIGQNTNLDGKVLPGVVNYVITTLLKTTFPIESYSAYNTQVGILECVKLELYRKMAAPYEDQKEFENGQVDSLL